MDKKNNELKCDLGILISMKEWHSKVGKNYNQMALNKIYASNNIYEELGYALEDMQTCNCDNFVELYKVIIEIGHKEELLLTKQIILNKLNSVKIGKEKKAYKQMLELLNNKTFKNNNNIDQK